MRDFDLSEISATYTSDVDGQTIDMSMTEVVIPDPHHRYTVSIGDEYISFTAGELFKLLKWAYWQWGGGE